MESHPNRVNKSIEVALSTDDVISILSGESITNDSHYPPVTAGPLSEVNPDSRRIEKSDGKRVRDRLSAMTCQATIMNGRVFLHIPEALLQDTRSVRSEQLGPHDITGDRTRMGVDSITIEFPDYVEKA